MAKRRRIDVVAGQAALQAWECDAQILPGPAKAVVNPAGQELAGQEEVAPGAVGPQKMKHQADVAMAVRFALEEFAQRHPGRAVEIRVPPFGATQAVAGVQHRRGTPPAVVEMSADTWLGLVTGLVSWDMARAGGQVDASGQGCELGEYLPLFG